MTRVGAVKAAMAAVKVAHRISSSSNISRSTSSISRSTSESSPCIINGNNIVVSNISGGTSHSSLHRSRNISSSIGGVISDRSSHSNQADGVHHVCPGCGQSGHFLSKCRAVPLHHRTRIFRTRTRARKLPPFHLLETAPTLGADLHHHHSQLPPRRTCMNRLFRQSHRGAPPPTEPPWRNMRHQASPVYRVYVW